MKRLLLAAAALTPLVAALPAAAQLETREAISLQNQILELHHELDALRAQGAAPQGYAQPPASSDILQGPTSDIVSQLLTRVGTLEEEVRQLRGRVDDLQNTLQQSTADLGKRIDDLSFQLHNSPGAPPAAPSASPGPGQFGAAAASPATAAPPAPASPGPRTPETALLEGDSAFARGDYAAAEKDAQEVLSKKASPRAYDAQYLLAQSLAGQHQWSRAAIAYDDAYNRSPKGIHAQTALLGLAISLTAINERSAACQTIDKLHRQFPKVDSKLLPQIHDVAQRSGCK